jgi:hypothetical protein
MAQFGHTNNYRMPEIPESGLVAFRTRLTGRWKVVSKMLLRLPIAASEGRAAWNASKGCIGKVTLYFGSASAAIVPRRDGA